MLAVKCRGIDIRAMQNYSCTASIPEQNEPRLTMPAKRCTTETDVLGTAHFWNSKKIQFIEQVKNSLMEGEFEMSAIVNADSEMIIDFSMFENMHNFDDKRQLKSHDNLKKKMKIFHKIFEFPNNQTHQSPQINSRFLDESVASLGRLPFGRQQWGRTRAADCRHPTQKLKL